MSGAAIYKYNQSLEALHGLHAAKNLGLSFRLNEEAAEEGYHDAILAMGWYYLNGCGVSRNKEKAKEWYKKSARSGEVRAMYSLGEIAFYECDYITAKTWFDRAIHKGHTGSHYMLGKMYWMGRGVQLDRKMAIRLISIAAKKNYPKARRAIRFLTRKK